MDAPLLGPRELERYGRHLVLPEVGLDGQLRLARSSALVVGAGGLGSPVSLYLAAAGVGRLGLVDFDRVEASNLQRQILYGTRDIGRPKLDAARERLSDVNPCIEVVTHAGRLAPDNARAILEGYQVVIDGTDNFPTRYLVNDACVQLGIPNVYGSIYRFEGQVAVFDAARGPCYRCLYPEPPPPGVVPSCAEGGVLGILPGVIGALQATEAIKLLLGRGEPLVGRLVLFDALALVFRELRLRKDPACPACGPGARQELVLEPAACTVPATPASESWEIDVRELARVLESDDVPLVLDVRTPEEWAICRLPRAQLVPLHELMDRLGELDRTRPIIAYCHVGMRSAHAVGLLRQHGFSARNLVGGIDAWAAVVDPTMPRY
jgi:adenylyltransferase/sulfurtransferase